MTSAGDSELVARTAAWKAMPRTSRDEQAQAERFYEEQVFPLIRESFEREHAPRYRGRYQAVIFSIGTSWEPVVLTWSAIRPERALFLHTHGTEPLVTRIVEKLQLPPDRWQRETVDEADPTPIYRAIKEFYARWRLRGRMAVDFTSGTKAMTSGAAMAGAVLGLDLLYVANRRYLADLRRPEPGSEYLTRVANPLEVFGDLEEMEAFRLAARHDWSAVRQIAASLHARLPSVRFHSLQLLAEAYERWDQFDLAGAATALGSLVEWASEHPASVLPGWLPPALEHLRVQHDLVSRAAAVLGGSPRTPGTAGSTGHGPGAPAGSGRQPADREAFAALTASLYAGALRRAERGMNDVAVLLLHRALELIGQRRLALYGLDAAEFTCERMPAPLNDPARLLESVNSRRVNLKLEPLAGLPRQLGLVMTYVVLDVLQDPPVQRINLRELNGQAEARNRGFLAHGFRVTDAARFERFREFVERVARLFFEAEGLGFDEWVRRATFVIPGEPARIAGGEPGESRPGDVV